MRIFLNEENESSVLDFLVAISLEKENRNGATKPLGIVFHSGIYLEKTAWTTLF